MQHYFIDPNNPEEEISEDLYRRMMRKRQSLEGAVIDAEVAAAVGLLYVEVSDPPSFDSSSHKAVKTERKPVSGNTFRQGWEVVPLSAAELDARAADMTRKVAQAKSSKRADITQSIAQADRTHFVFEGKQIALDDASFRRICTVNATVALLNEFPEGWLGHWKAMDNSSVPLPDVKAWKAFIRAMAAQGMANFSMQQTLKAQVEASATLSQIAAINTQ